MGGVYGGTGGSRVGKTTPSRRPLHRHRLHRARKQHVGFPTWSDGCSATPGRGSAGRTAASGEPATRALRAYAAASFARLPGRGPVSGVVAE